MEKAKKGGGWGPRDLPLSKLHLEGIEYHEREGFRMQLKTKKITTVGRFLDATGSPKMTHALASSMLPANERRERSAQLRAFDRLNYCRRVCRLSLIRGLGWQFIAILFTYKSTFCIEDLRNTEPTRLHAELVKANGSTATGNRIARRSPTLEEVTGWIEAADAILKSEAEARLRLVGPSETD